ncbi:hypothetical protein V8G54_019574 [Vigna mungo]|uniref:Uncharacterized protein n=1 Tax=Vigna mungo TaxID=3915 RepID=A0AAQ3RV37_VIGMU
MKNHTLCKEEKTKTEGRFVIEKYSMMEEEGDATIKRVEDVIMIGTSMPLEFWDSTLLGSESGIQKPLSYQPPPKPPYLKFWGPYNPDHRCPKRSMRVMIMAEDDEGGEEKEEEEMEQKHTKLLSFSAGGLTQTDRYKGKVYRQKKNCMI